MSHAPQFWLWFPRSGRWVAATIMGAARQFLDSGHEVAYGRHHPCRPGVDPENFPPLLRPEQWRAFTADVAQYPTERHRVSPV